MCKDEAGFVGGKWARPWCPVGELSWRARGAWARLVAAELLQCEHQRGLSQAPFAPKKLLWCLLSEADLSTGRGRVHLELGVPCSSRGISQSR